MPDRDRCREHDCERIHRDRADDAASLAFDANLSARHVATEAVRVPDRDEADPGGRSAMNLLP